MTEDVRSRIESLRQKIHYHNHRYYVLDSPDISDTEYDLLFEQLCELERACPELVTPDSPTQRVGAEPLKSFSTVLHIPRMLSLSNAMNETEVRRFDERITKKVGAVEYMVEPKFDGLAVELIFEDRIFVTGSTRGNGDEGEDITQNLKTIKSIPLKLFSPVPCPVPETVRIRGEIIMKRKDFEQLNSQRSANGEALFANPRNAAAGSVRQLDPSVTAARRLDAYFYDIADKKVSFINTQSDVLDTLLRWGVKVHPKRYLCSDIESTLSACREIEEMRNRFDYDIDGAVIKVNRIDQQDVIGVLPRTPKWAVAFKFKPRQAETVLRDIVLQVGRTGVLTPVAVLEPVRIAGVEIRRATLHNRDEIEKKDIRIGDRVIVQRAGDVIPEVVSPVVSKRTGTEKRFTMPSACPVCGSPVKQIKSEASHRCLNALCPAVVKQTLKHFASRKAMNIDGLGDRLIDALVDNRLVSSPADFYSLTADSLKNLERMAEKSAGNIIDAIEKSKQAAFPRVLYALGIRHIGEQTALSLAAHFNSIDRIQKASVDELMAIKDIGPEAARSIADFMARQPNITMIEMLRNSGLKMQLDGAPDGMQQKEGITGKTFVFTGTLKKRTRAQAEELVRSAGGKTAGSVSRKTDAVVAGEDPGSKVDTARNLNIRILSEDEFYSMIF